MLTAQLDTVDHEWQTFLGAQLQVKEVLRGIRLLKNQVAPGPDGITSEVYKTHPDLWAIIFARIFNRARDEGELPTLIGTPYINIRTSSFFFYLLKLLSTQCIIFRSFA